MLIIVRTIVVLLLDLLVCYLCGKLFIHIVNKKMEHPFTDVIVGFLLLQIGFELLTLLFHWREKGLKELSYTWLVMVGVVCLISIILSMKAGKHCDKKLPKDTGAWKMIAITVLVVGFFCYYVSVNGEINDDSRYYIALVNTTLNTQTLFQYNPYNGILGGAWFARRALTTFEIHSAMLCYVFQIPALVITRIMRASQNVILTSMAVYLCGKSLLFRNDRKVVEKSCELVIVNLVFQMLFAGTIYTNATFFLFRSYEGKAFTANVLILFTMYVCVEIMRQKNKRNFLLLLLVIWGAVAISSSGMLIIPVEMGLFLLPYMIVQFVHKRMERRHAEY